ncbi:MAG: Hsp20/alpha crystallin family protein [Bacteroidales bacterium]|nr:Hsp20/alpha crystallin family protein [Bacteroidales bacterium]
MLPVRRTTNSWMPDIFNDFFDNSWMERANNTAPAINVIENEKEYNVELAAPGLAKEDFKVHVDHEGNLNIEMEKKSENKEGAKHGRYLRREFSYEKYQQTLLLPDDVDAERISAKMENGVLDIVLPKLTKVQKEEAVKQIDIR